MASTTNATTVFYGTAWDDRTLLERAKQRHLELERRDGAPRPFEYDGPGGRPAPPVRAVGRGDGPVRPVGPAIFPRNDAVVHGPRIELVEHYVWTGEPH